MDDNFPEDERPEGDPDFDKTPSGMFPSPEELAARDLADRKRRVELSEYFAAEFDPSDPREQPHDAQNHLLQLDELDRQMANPKRLLLRDYLGNPWIKPLADILPEKLEEELDLLLEFMNLYKIAVDFLEDVTDQEAYRFIVEELLDEEITDMAATGMTTHFIYEEFHPNDEYDAKLCAEGFLYALLRQDAESVKFWVAKDDLRDPKGNPISRVNMLKLLGLFRSRYSAVTGVRIEPVSCKLEEDLAVVEITTTYTGITVSPINSVKIVGQSTIWLKRHNIDSWLAVRARIAGWDQVGWDQVGRERGQTS